MWVFNFKTYPVWYLINYMECTSANLSFMWEKLRSGSRHVPYYIRSNYLATFLAIKLYSLHTEFSHYITLQHSLLLVQWYTITPYSETDESTFWGSPYYYNYYAGTRHLSFQGFPNSNDCSAYSNVRVCVDRNGNNIISYVTFWKCRTDIYYCVFSHVAEVWKDLFENEKLAEL